MEKMVRFNNWISEVGDSTLGCPAGFHGNEHHYYNKPWNNMK